MDARAWAWPDRQRLVEADQRWAIALNRGSAYRALLIACRVTSRLANGVIWYALIIALPIAAGAAGWRCAGHMLCAGLVSLAVYLLLKRRVGRPRPHTVCPDIQLRGQVLDQFSFPSGHTLHAMGFSLVLAYYFPIWLLVLVPFMLLVALSRVVLGLHYPSDVLAGAVVGAIIGCASIWIL